MDWKYLFTSFQGRINRQPYWLSALALAILLGILEFVVFYFFMTWGPGETEGSYVATSVNPIAWVLIAIMVVVGIWAGLAIQVKRWHDRDKSGWWVLIGLVPVIGGIWALVECGFLRGTPGANRFGPDPLAGQ